MRIAQAQNKAMTFMKIMRDKYAIRSCRSVLEQAQSLPMQVNLSDVQTTLILEIIMTWTTPAATDLRFGFEITMYIANR